MYEVWYQEIEELTARANAWCNFALWCGWIGFGLSVACAIYLIVRYLHERKD